MGRLVLCTALATVGLPLLVLAQNFEISRHTIDGGGVMRSAGGEFELSGTIGQPDAGLLSGGSIELAGGFWFPIAPTDCNEDGSANLLDFEAFETCLGGPADGVPEGCSCFDVDGSGNVDLRDVAIGQVAFSP